MPHLPAICDNCGTMFPSGIVMNNCTNVRLSGNKSGPCPSCGGWGSVPDGLFNVLGNVIEIIDAPRKTLEQLSRYVQVLNSARDENLSREQVKDKIEKDVPELACISDILPKTRAELYAFIGLLLAALTFMMSIMEDDETAVVEPQVILEQTINNYNYNLPTQMPSNNSAVRNYSGAQPFKQKVGRNESCPCGSGVKYKKCCLNLI